MSAVTAARPFRWRWLKRPDMLALVTGVLLLVVPTYVRLASTLWAQDAYEHGALVAAVFWWLVWGSRDELMAAAGTPQVAAGSALFVAGLLLYFVGRSQTLPLFEVAAHLPVFAGLALALGGWQALRVMWFPLVFLVFMVPLPGFIIVGITAELKQYVSAIAESLLYHAGYPIGRDGVMITIGQYRMLVADACSGLNSMYSLTALGLLYLYLVRRSGWAHNALLLAAILPTAFAANVVRVVVLILLTFHFGDDVGQGFLHGASGVLLFVFSLLLLMAIDAMLVAVARWRRGGSWS